MSSAEGFFQDFFPVNLSKVLGIEGRRGYLMVGGFFRDRRRCL